LPRDVGLFEGEEIVAGVGRYGPYIRHKGKFYSLGRPDDPHSIQLDRAIEIIGEKRTQEQNRNIKQFEEEPGLQVLNGRYGPYISFQKKNYRIPKGRKPEDLSLEDCREIIARADARARK
jgi:DNA topoisomerase-1